MIRRNYFFRASVTNYRDGKSLGTAVLCKEFTTKEKALDSAKKHTVSDTYIIEIRQYESSRLNNVVSFDFPKNDTGKLVAVCVDGEVMTGYIRDVRFEEMWGSDMRGYHSMYFIAPKECLKALLPFSDYPDATSMEISIEFPATSDSEDKEIYVQVSPTRMTDSGSDEDYDWTDIELPEKEVRYLLSLGERTVK